MSEQMSRRTFIGKAAAAGTALGGLTLRADEHPAASQPALEWRNRQPTMGYARLGRTHFMTSRCVFGAGQVTNPDDLRLLEVAIERGMNYIDTGRFYRNSEATIAQLCRKHRDKFWIVSKAAHIGWPDMTIQKGEDAKAARLYTEQLDASLAALKVDVIDCYMVQGVEHDWIVTMDSLYAAFEKACKAGKVRYLGLSTHTNVAQICELAARTGRYDVVMLAVHPGSLGDLRPAIKAMRDAGIGVVSMKTSAPIRRDPRAFDGQYDQMFAGQQLSPYQRAYAYMLARGGIDAFIAHMPNRRILDENLAVPALKLGQAELDRLERRARAEARGACRHCSACSRACPEGVNVADMLRYHAYASHYGEPEVARALYRLAGEDRAWRCTSCGACQASCPETIDLAAVIAGVRSQLA